MDKTPLEQLEEWALSHHQTLFRIEQGPDGVSHIRLFWRDRHSSPGVFNIVNARAVNCVNGAIREALANAKETEEERRERNG